ncbi:MAG: formylglycine-generating enzyme family protein [Prevotella sp.]|nr:formylglycine-generating enzyme family protein [Prevotella sp.]
MRSINESMGYEVLTTNEETTSFVDLLPRDGKNNYVVYAISDNEMSEPSAAASVIYEKEVSFTVNSASFKMVKVVGGTFEMGQTGWKEYPSYTNEKPVHQVTLFDFCIGATEVTQDLWEAVMGSNPSWFKGTNLPVESVSWNDCQEFIKKLNSLTGKNFRLPTEAEWEYSARARTNQYWEYSGADESFIDAVAWYRDNSNGETHVVATKKPNSLGLYDMSGNVAEWCQDWYGDYGSEAQMNPSGPFSGSIRVSRGGSWFQFASSCRVSYRGYAPPSYRGSSYGLRLALSSP